MRKPWTIGAIGGVSLLALAVVLPTATSAQLGRPAAAPAMSSSRVIGTFTPATRDPQLEAHLARLAAQGGSDVSAYQFTPAGSDSENRSIRVAIRARPGAPLMGEAARPTLIPSEATVTPSGTQILPSSYNLGVSLGWRRFAATADVASSGGGAVPGSRESARIGVEYRANRRLTGRVQLQAERAEGAQQIVANDRAYSLDVGGSYSISRNVAVTGGLRYRVQRDRLDPVARDERRDSQAVYIGTAFRF